jgi:hypothetical protein
MNHEESYGFMLKNIMQVGLANGRIKACGADELAN